MARIGPLRVDSINQWKYGLLGGLVSIPVTSASHWQTGSEMSFSAVLLGGPPAGYLAKRKAGTSSGVGVRAGLVGALPVLWVVYDVSVAASALSGPTWFVASGLGLTVSIVVVIAIFSFGLSAVVGAIGERIGSWLAGSNGRHGPAAAGI